MIFLFLLFVNANKIFVNIVYSEKYINRDDLPLLKNLMTQRINDLSNEFDCTFNFQYSYKKEGMNENEVVYKFNITSKKDIVDKINKLKFGEVPEEGEIDDATLKDLYFRNETFDSVGIIIANGYPLRLSSRSLIETMNFGFSIEFLPLVEDNYAYTFQGQELDLTLPVIGKQTHCKDTSVCFENARECPIDCPIDEYPSNVKFCTSNGVWNSPVCQCNTKDLIKFGITKQYPCPSTEFGRTCYLKCGKGLYSNEYLESKCDKETKKWIEPIGKCFCENIAIEGIDSTSCFESLIGSYCTYHCTQTEKFPKHKSLHCTHNGWDNVPVCGKKCKNIIIDNSVEPMENKEYFEDDEFEINCRSGFFEIGKRPTCLRTGQWSANSVSCENIAVEDELGDNFPPSNDWNDFGVDCSAIEKIFFYLIDGFLLALVY